MIRCEWGDTSPLYQQYHDEEWGVPLHNDQALFEFLILKGTVHENCTMQTIGKLSIVDTLFIITQKISSTTNILHSQFQW